MLHCGVGLEPMMSSRHIKNQWKEAIRINCVSSVGEPSSPYSKVPSGQLSFLLAYATVYRQTIELHEPLAAVRSKLFHRIVAKPSSSKVIGLTLPMMHFQSCAIGFEPSSKFFDFQQGYIQTLA